MRKQSLSIEIQKLRRGGVIETLIFASFTAALYAVMNWFVRKDFLLAADIDPMIALLTQLYGAICLINIFAIIVSASNIYHIEHQNNGLKKMQTLPIKISEVFVSKFFILICALLIAYLIEFITLAFLGKQFLPEEAFNLTLLIQFAVYTFVIMLPCLAFMLVISELSTNLWITVGIGVVGFFSGMAMVGSDHISSLLNPFVLILKPALELSAEVDLTLLLISVIETIIFVLIGIIIADKRKFE